MYSWSGWSNLKTTTGGILNNFTITSSEIPDKYFLSRNYPNPFNPTTAINYNIPIKTHYNASLQIKVYDVLENEIAIVVNEYKQSGSYSVTFDGTDYPSGVYYYKFTSGNYVKVRKMLLIK